MKILRILAVVASLAIANYATASQYIPTGTLVTINDGSTNQVTLGTDTLENMSLLMAVMRDKDHAALKELYHEGHVIPVKNGSRGRTIKYANNCYLIRLQGSSHPVWVFENIVQKAE
jgi:hypothetical protein